MYILENKKLKITVNPIGAELAGIYNKSNTKEYLWQGTPEVWAGQAPVLFPIIGALKDNSYYYNDKKYTLPKHGFIRYNTNLVTTEHTDEKVVLQLTSSPDTLEKYPFHFSFEISYQLKENQLIISHTIKNTGKETMYFSVGGHPAFQCPTHASASYNDYYIQLQHGGGAVSYILNDNGLISEKIVNVFDEDKIHLTATIFDQDALIFKNIKAQQATLHHKEEGKVLSVTFTDFPDLGIWAKPNAPFICIEPWLGYADEETTNQMLSTKKGMQTIATNGIHQSSYTVEIY